MVKIILRSLVLAVMPALASEGSVHADQPDLRPPLQRAPLLERFFTQDEGPLVQYRALK
jgi:hypothetical protein